MAKKFMPTFDAEDLTKLPNYESIVVAQIGGVPSAPFSMSFIPPLGRANPQLSEALKRLSAAKYGRPRLEVEKEIFTRLRAGDVARDDRMKALAEAKRPGIAPGAGGGSSFLDEWLAKRQQLAAAPKPAVPPTSLVKPVPATSRPVAAPPVAPVVTPVAPSPRPPVTQKPYQPDIQPVYPIDTAQQNNLKFDSQKQSLKDITTAIEPKDPSTLTIPKVQPNQPPAKHDLDEIYIDVRGDLHHRSDNKQDTPTA
jgi:hypothetical protein